MSQAYGKTTQRQQMEGVHQGERINVQGWTQTGLRSMVCRWRHWCFVVRQLRHHRLFPLIIQLRDIYNQYDKRYLEREGDILL